ncbi:hypothetical protein OAK75_12975 [Bacteriovoracales bacterium]|nr:hypothetical protein [Bacteriovoracales bacterium]
MLEKDVYLTTVGKSFLSFIFSLSFLDKGHKVLLLDDERLSYGELFTDTFWELEKELLKTWGKERKISSLESLDDFLMKKHIVFVVGERRIRLGDTPSRNLVELSRKMPILSKGRFKDIVQNILSSEKNIKSFDDSFLSLCRRVGQNCFKYKTLQSLDMNFFLTHCPANIKELYHLFCKILDSDTDNYLGPEWQLKTLALLGRGFYQKKLTWFANEFERFHFFLCLLSPHYRPDQEGLISSLKDCYQLKGGQFKKTSIKEWVFHTGTPWCLELESYEGLVHPERIAFFGGISNEIPLKIGKVENFFSSLKIVWDLKEDLEEDFWGERIVKTELKRLGTQRPFWEASFEKNKIVINVIIPFERGSKTSFISEKIEREMIKELNPFCPFIEDKIDRREFFFTPEVWLHGKNIKYYKKPAEMSFYPNVDLYDLSKIGKRNKLRKVDYFGPLKEGYGLFSSLMEIKDANSFIRF